METRTYDAIVIGAGHNGLCLAAYLARAGLRTAIVERRHEEGGGINTEEPLLPGFRFNMHAQYMEFFDIMPMVQDFGLYDLGLRALMPEAQAGITFSDGRAPIVIYRPDMNDQTHASIARYSRSDADTFMELKNRTMQLEMLLAASLYTPPVHAEVDPQAMLLEAVYSDLGLTRAHALKSPKMLIDELFESDELRTLMYRVSIEWGFPIDASSTAAGFLAFVMWTIGNWKMAVGGTHTLAKAMTQACYREGVDLIENTMVESIIVEEGRAVGVRTRSGDIRATRCMASNADLKQTMLDLVGEEHLSDLWVRRTKNFRYGPSHVLGTTIMCIRDAPRYLSAKHDPNIDRCFYTVVGLENAEQMARYARDAYMGRIPEAGAGTWVNSLWDPAQAPAGFHSATGWYFFPRASDLSAEEWDEVRRTYNDQMLAKWRAAAPNMTADNVIAHKLYTPDQMERKNMMMEGDFSNGEFVADQVGANRPFPEASNFRTEIDGLYLCGPSAYPGGGASAAPGYNAYKAIAEDLALTSPVVGARGY